MQYIIKLQNNELRIINVYGFIPENNLGNPPDNTRQDELILNNDNSISVDEIKKAKRITLEN